MVDNYHSLIVKIQITVEHKRLTTLFKPCFGRHLFKVWRNRDSDFDTFIKHIATVCKVKSIISSEFDDCMYSEKILAGPAFGTCRKFLEPLVEKLEPPRNGVKLLLNKSA
jgi:hypothetical protein